MQIFSRFDAISILIFSHFNKKSRVTIHRANFSNKMEKSFYRSWPHACKGRAWPWVLNETHSLMHLSFLYFPLTLVPWRLMKLSFHNIDLFLLWFLSLALYLALNLVPQPSNFCSHHSVAQSDLSTSNTLSTVFMPFNLKFEISLWIVKR